MSEGWKSERPDGRPGGLQALPWAVSSILRDESAVQAESVAAEAGEPLLCIRSGSVRAV
jgi:hypothetical protein